MSLRLACLIRFCQTWLAVALVLLGSVSAEAQCRPQQIFKLLANDGAAGDNFGGSVAISGTTAIVGALFDDDNGENSGSAYLVDATTGQQIGKLVADDGTAGDRFGAGVAISGTVAVVGSHENNGIANSSGAAYLFETS